MGSNTISEQKKEIYESETCGQNLFIPWSEFAEGSGTRHVRVLCMSLAEVDPRPGEGPWTRAWGDRTRGNGVPLPDGILGRNSWL